MVPKFRAFLIEAKTMRDVVGIDFVRNMYCLQVGRATIGEWFWYRDLELMQSTGLKDLKGVEIFEGDVVWIIDKGEMDNGWGWFEEVKFRNGSFMAGDDFLINSNHRCVVHGNIYEREEPLEQENES